MPRWNNLNPGAVRGGSHSFSSSSMEIPSPCSPHSQGAAITVHMIHSTGIFFHHILYMRLHFRAILKTPLLQKILSLQCHFSDSACPSNLCSKEVVPHYHKMFDAFVWTSKNKETWRCCLHPHSHHWHHGSHHSLTTSMRSVCRAFFMMSSAPEQTPSLVQNRAKTSQKATSLLYLQRSGF